MSIVELGFLYDETDPKNPVKLEGWHVDSLEAIPGADDFLIKPDSPKHGFLGVESCFKYRFYNKAHAQLFIKDLVI